MSSFPSHVDVLILGSGFGGSLLATILARSGKSVVLVDRARHPRFAIGESSTPLADRTLMRLATRYGIPEVQPLCRWGSWKRFAPQLLCGRKRGFTYLDQTSNGSSDPGDFTERRLLVAASVDNEHSDTHWLRSDVDQFLFRLAGGSGVCCLESCVYDLNRRDVQGGGWVIEGRSGQSSFRFSAEFLVDATGSPGAVLRLLGIADQTHLLRTNARTVFAHFSGTRTCEELLRSHGLPLADFPFPCDDAAVHQVLPDGWMWQLRFDDSSLSAGFMIDCRSGRENNPADRPADEEWSTRIAMHPFLRSQFSHARVIRPDGGLQRTGRIQRLAACGAGEDWAALTNTVGFVDPLHSTGIAHTLFSIERLASILLSGTDRSRRTSQLQHYSSQLVDEIRCVDELVEGCYQGLPSFTLWCQWAMLYFAAVTSMEQQSVDDVPGSLPFGCGFLRAGDSAFRSVLRDAREQLARASAPGLSPAAASKASSEFAEWLRTAVAPWNTVGLFDDAAGNLYSATAVPADCCDP